MVEMTMSFSKGKKNETSIKHNNRSIEKDFDFNKKGHQHINPDFTPLNEVLVHNDIKEVYQEEFGSAVKKYNAKQKRKDRKIKDYYQKIKHSKNMRTQYEFLVQVGNKNDFEHDKTRTTSRLWQDSKNILEAYLEHFELSYPNLRVYNAVIHMDEEGAPHMHMNIVPVAHLKNVKRGLDTKPSLNQALAENGFPIEKDDNRKQFKDFQHKEANNLAEYADIYGITRKAGVVNRLGNVHEYKKTMDQLDKAEFRLFEISSEEDQINSKIKNKQKKLDLLNDTYENRKQQVDKQYQERINSHNNQLNQLGSLLDCHTTKNPEDYIVIGNFGKVDKEATAKNIKQLQDAVATSNSIKKITKNQAILNDNAIKKAISPLIKENKAQAETIANQNTIIKSRNLTIELLKNEVTTLLETSRDIYQNSKEKLDTFFQLVGKTLKKHFKTGQVSSYGFDTAEKENIKKGMHAEQKPKPKPKKRTLPYPSKYEEYEESDDLEL